MLLKRPIVKEDVQHAFACQTCTKTFSEYLELNKKLANIENVFSAKRTSAAGPEIIPETEVDSIENHQTDDVNSEFIYSNLEGVILQAGDIILQGDIDNKNEDTDQGIITIHMTEDDAAIMDADELFIESQVEIGEEEEADFEDQIIEEEEDQQDLDEMDNVPEPIESPQVLFRATIHHQEPHFNLFLSIFRTLQKPYEVRSAAFTVPFTATPSRVP